MAAGDIKGDAVVTVLTAGAAVTKGQVVALQADGKYDPCTDAMKGKFAVAVEAASGDTVTFRAVIRGFVEVTATAAAIAKGARLMAGTTGLVAANDFLVYGEDLGWAFEAIASGGSGTIHLEG